VNPLEHQLLTGRQPLNVQGGNDEDYAEAWLHSVAHDLTYIVKKGGYGMLWAALDAEAQNIISEAHEHVLSNQEVTCT